MRRLEVLRGRGPKTYCVKRKVTFDYSDFLIRLEQVNGGNAHSRLGTSQLRGRRIVASSRQDLVGLDCEEDDERRATHQGGRASFRGILSDFDPESDAIGRIEWRKTDLIEDHSELSCNVSGQKAQKGCGILL